MRAPARERMISFTALVLVISIGFLVPKAAAQSDKYPKMAPVDQYLMERNAEILLARSAAPDSISSDATILVLGRQGYETAVGELPACLRHFSSPPRSNSSNRAVHFLASPKSTSRPLRRSTPKRRTNLHIAVKCI